MGGEPPFRTAPALRAGSTHQAVSGWGQTEDLVRVFLPGRVRPPPATARRFAPAIETPLRAFGALRRVPIGPYRLVKGGHPLSHFPPKSLAANQRFAAIRLLRGRQYAAGSDVRAADPRIAEGEEARGRLGAQTSGRHPGPQGREPRIADPREARATAGPHRENWPPVSDRHRAGARNLRRRRCATPM